MADIFADCGVPVIFLLLAVGRLNLISDLTVRISAGCLAALYLFSLFRPIHLYVPSGSAPYIIVFFAIITIFGGAALVFGVGQTRDERRRT
ncbi:hypothetical protein EWE75_23640 [Sphingomonas populi]|uniref:Uncharacterized protein n=1 Tax=Sphingomonas populi TaxID=2484750 RepID=A0A4Q6XGN6_9SPHN|nr:hypothetical protein [Sphingomonas populi]RZF59090.1 hypothetical protein EWE75_23640 [Sphingomonas populi]